jgi:DNA-binding response OmpR family regulator
MICVSSITLMNGEEKQMRILLIEDDEGISRVIRRGLEAAGYTVELAADGETGLEMALNGSFSLLILDLMLPGRDGCSVCREFRMQDSHTPVLMLTARDGLEERLRGFDAGAEDYLGKPFHFAELLARVRVLTRREAGLPLMVAAPAA